MARDGTQVQFLPSMQALGPTVNPQELGVFLTLPFYKVLVTSVRILRWGKG